MDATFDLRHPKWHFRSLKYYLAILKYYFRLPVSHPVFCGLFLSTLFLSPHRYFPLFIRHTARYAPQRNSTQKLTGQKPDRH